MFDKREKTQIDVQKILGQSSNCNWKLIAMAKSTFRYAITSERAFELHHWKISH